ncbi:MAG TPA: glycosyltransferase [Baekduia sp.]|uniref:glycosyltransferase n=1 Tax=Baekduia sp. TaxID=2600305 RepID=UPI002D774909|nr:glycosyltransferase [Baekduia sp.]HET6508414.1 glycosyltransferase [Baekduia sp.]
MDVADFPMAHARPLSRPAQPRPVYVGTGAQATFGLFHDAPAGATPGAPVLLLGPFGNADATSYRPRRDWAQLLAADGHPTLRVDLPGTGDGPGGPRDPDRLGAWIAGAADAARWLAATTGRHVTAIGIGLGGVVGTAAAAAGAPIDDLVLWAVPSRGRTVVRELKMLSRMQAAAAGATSEQLMDGVPEGALMTAGALLSAETVAALTALDLAATPLDGALARRALLLGRDGVEPEARLAEALAAAGAEVETLPGDGYGDLLMQPSEARTPYATIAAVGAWLARGTAQPYDGEAPPSDLRLEIDVDGVTIEERPFTVDAAGVAMLGILAEPAAGQPVSDTCLVLLHPGALRRVGHNRMWLELARRWAARGVPSLRIDLARVGDLDAEPQDAEQPGVYDLHAHFHPQLAVQLQETLAALQDAVRPKRFILGGLCSGGYWTFEALRADPRVSAGLIVNPGLFFGGPMAALAREREALSNIRTLTLWRKVLRGGVSVARARQLAGIFARGAVSTARQKLRRRHEAPPLDAALEGIAASDQRVSIVFSPGEPFRDELEASGDLARLAADPHVELETLQDVPRAHTLEPLPLQREVQRFLDAAIERELARHDGGADAAPTADGDRPLRVLHVAESLATGVLAVVSALSERLADHGHEVIVAHGVRPETPDDVRGRFDERVRVVALPWRRRTIVEQLRAAVALRRLVRDVRPDVVHLHSTFAGAVGALALGRGTARVYSPHGYSFSRAGDGGARLLAYRLFEAVIARRVDLVGAVSRSEAAQASRDIRAPRVSVVANGLPELDPGHEPTPPERPVPRVVALGRVGPQHQPEQAARILGRLSDVAEVRWIGGAAGDASTAGVAALEAAGVALTGWLDAADARRELAAATAMLHWTAWDAQSMAVLEAMARDVVVIASDIAPSEELLGAGQTCASEDEAVALLRAVVEDAAVRERLIASQRHRRTHYSADRMAADWLAVYRTLVAARPFTIPT